jgi:hypothetical protein
MRRFLILHDGEPLPPNARPHPRHTLGQRTWGVMTMKYMLLIYTAENSYDDGERQQCYVESTDLARQLHESGQYVSANPLQSVATATSVRVREGKRLVTDGPFAETREQLGGYFLIEARDLDEAISVAGRIPGARKGSVEIRPVLEISGLPTAAGAPALAATV